MGPKPAPSPAAMCGQHRSDRFRHSSLVVLAADDLACHRIDQLLDLGALLGDGIDLIAAVLDLDLSDLRPVDGKLGLDRILAHPLALRRIAAFVLVLGGSTADA